MDIETIIYDNYTFKIELDTNQIKLNMTDNTLMEIYEGSVKEDDLYVKPIKKFYSMIIRSLNKEASFNFSIDNRNSKMVCTVSYSTDMVDLEEHIILNKISSSESRELLLVRKVKELEDMLTPVFGYCYNTQEKMMFKLDSTVLDFTPFNFSGPPVAITSAEKDTKYFISNNLNITEYNKFTKVKEIIFDAVLSPIYCSNNYVTYESNYICQRPNNELYIRGGLVDEKFEGINIFRSFRLYLPTINEVKIYYSNTDCLEGPGLLSGNQLLQRVSFVTQCNDMMFKSFPNLTKISLINNGIPHKHMTEICIHSLTMSLGYCNKKINHIILKGMNICASTFEQGKLEALKKNIKLEIS